tara:strand:- start:1050 stop:1190 length:141 start_codon:yes stop_codon:yes gene_type:complete
MMVMAQQILIKTPKFQAEEEVGLLNEKALFSALFFFGIKEGKAGEK